MANDKDQTGAAEEDYDSNLKGTFVTVILVGAFIFLSWLGIFIFYITTI